MQSLTITVLALCTAYATAQLGGSQNTGGSMTPVNNQQGTSNNPMMPPTPQGYQQQQQQQQQNPLSHPLTWALLGGDKLRRLAVAPYLPTFGGSSLPSLYYMQGGMDKYMKATRADMYNRMLAQMMGINPAVSSLFTSQWTDAPDGYALMQLMGVGSGGMGPTMFNPATAFFLNGF